MPVVIQLRVHAKDLDLNPNIWYIQTVHEKQKLPERNVITIRHKKSLTTHWSDLNWDETSEKILQKWKNTVPEQKSLLKSKWKGS